MRSPWHYLNKFNCYWALRLSFTLARAAQAVSSFRDLLTVHFPQETIHETTARSFAVNRAAVCSFCCLCRVATDTDCCPSQPAGRKDRRRNLIRQDRGHHS